MKKVEACHGLGQCTARAKLEIKKKKEKIFGIKMTDIPG